MTATFREYLAFLRAGLAKHSQTGAVLPSQRFLIERMLAPVHPDFDGAIIELGSGTGALTLRLAQRCHRARLLVCEINPALARVSRARLSGAGMLHRVELIEEPAERFLASLGQRGVRDAHYVLSGIPLGNMGGEDARALIRAIHGALAPGGLYIQFQHLPLDARKVRDLFPRLRISPVFLNAPPALVYYAPKEGAA